jgi:hypothetical protein
MGNARTADPEWWEKIANMFRRQGKSQNLPKMDKPQTAA